MQREETEKPRKKSRQRRCWQKRNKRAQKKKIVHRTKKKPRKKQITSQAPARSTGSPRLHHPPPPVPSNLCVGQMTVLALLGEAVWVCWVASARYACPLKSVYWYSSCCRTLLLPWVGVLFLVISVDRLVGRLPEPTQEPTVREPAVHDVCCVFSSWQCCLLMFACRSFALLCFAAVLLSLLLADGLLLCVVLRVGAEMVELRWWAGKLLEASTPVLAPKKQECRNGIALIMEPNFNFRSLRGISMNM